MAKLASNLNEFNLSCKNPKMISPIEILHRKPKTLNFGDTLIAPIEKKEVPNHILNTSKIFL